MLSADNKITLAKPIQTYLALDEHLPETLGTSFPSAKGAASIPQRSIQRKRKTAEIALGRIAYEKRDFARGILYGIFFIIFGVIFILISFLRQTFISSDWLNWIGFAVGVLLLPLGVYFAYWFYKSSQSLSKDEEEIGEEIIRSA